MVSLRPSFAWVSMAIVMVACMVVVRVSIARVRVSPVRVRVSVFSNECEIATHAQLNQLDKEKNGINASTEIFE